MSPPSSMVPFNLLSIETIAPVCRHLLPLPPDFDGVIAVEIDEWRFKDMSNLAQTITEIGRQRPRIIGDEHFLVRGQNDIGQVNSGPVKIHCLPQ